MPYGSQVFVPGKDYNMLFILQDWFVKTFTVNDLFKSKILAFFLSYQHMWVIVFNCNLDISCRDIYVSPLGYDNEECGDKKAMCKNLNYALEYFSNSINVYLLDGGDNKPYSYSFEKSIPINNSTTIEAMPNRRFHPKIWQKDNPWVYIFEVRSTCAKLELRQINFRDSFIALINQGELIIEECDVSFSLYAPRSSLIYLWQDIRAAVLLVQITNSKFDQSYYILDVSTFFQHNITVHITNSTLISSRISFELAKDGGCNSNVNIVTDNTIIAEPKAFRSLCVSDGRHGNLLRLVKKECHYNGTGKSVIQVLNTTFSDTTNIPIYVQVSAYI